MQHIFKLAAKFRIQLWRSNSDSKQPRKSSLLYIQYGGSSAFPFSDFAGRHWQFSTWKLREAQQRGRYWQLCCKHAAPRRSCVLADFNAAQQSDKSPVNILECGCVLQLLPLCDAVLCTTEISSRVCEGQVLPRCSGGALSQFSLGKEYHMGIVELPSVACWLPGRVYCLPVGPYRTAQIIVSNQWYEANNTVAQIYCALRTLQEAICFQSFWKLSIILIWYNT